MKFSRIVTGAIAVLALPAAVAALGVSAGPAFASGSPVNVAATVNQSITMSGITGSIALAGNPGTVATNATAEVYNVVTNDSSGYSVTVTPGANNLSDSPKSDLIADSALSVNGSPFAVPAAPLTAHSKLTATNGSGDNYTDSWALAIPANQASGTYTLSATYLAVAS